MRNRRGYLTKMGLKNIITNRTMSTASVLVLVSCLMLIGLVFLAAINFNAMFRELSSYNVIRVFLVPGLQEYQLELLENRILGLDNVRGIDFVPHEEALRRMQHSHSDMFTLLEGRDERFLPDSFEVRPDRMGEFDITVQQLQNFDPAIESVGHVQDIAQQLSAVERAFLILGGAAVLVLLLVSIFIISSTVQTTMYTRQQEIKVMKSVGAAPSFIRWPFLVEGICIGLLGAIVALGVVFVVYLGVERALAPMLSRLLQGYEPLPFLQQLTIMLPLFFGVGILTGGGGSMLSITRYLKEKVYDSELEEV